MRPSEQELIYDWNTSEQPKAPPQTIEFDDETLRDGLQSPSVVSPDIDDKIRLVHLMDQLGIHTVDIGLPGAGPQVVETVRRLAQEIVDARLTITPNCAARTLEADIRPVAEISQSVGIPIEVCTFIGSSPIRQYAEDWTLDRLLRLTEEAVSFAVKEGLPVMFVTEDTTRAHPDHIRALFQTAIRSGATRVCVCDTVGHSTPEGAANVVRFAKQVVAETDPTVKVDWHGHQDRGLGLINTIAAAQAGADRVHGCGIGVGERVGNTAMDQILVNMKLYGWIDNDLSALQEYCDLVSRACEVPIPVSYPVVGRDAFRTGTGVHAAAVIKAYKKKDDWLVDRIYSGVPARWVGREQEIEIGPMSGESNVVFWLQHRAIDPRPELVKAIFAAAKESKRLLTDDQIHHIVRETSTKASA